MEPVDLDAWFDQIESTLGPDPTEDQVLEATKTAWLALTDEERESVSKDELRRRLAVYDSVKFG